jgi:hypothetical protein
MDVRSTLWQRSWGRQRTYIIHGVPVWVSSEEEPDQELVVYALLDTYLYTAVVRPSLEYTNQIWAPRLVKHIEAIEHVLRATKLISGMVDLSYRDRLRQTKLPM